jgi:hypothetical protein
MSQSTQDTVEDSGEWEVTDAPNPPKIPHISDADLGYHMLDLPCNLHVSGSIGNPGRRYLKCVLPYHCLDGTPKNLNIWCGWLDELNKKENLRKIDKLLMFTMKIKLTKAFTTENHGRQFWQYQDAFGCWQWLTWRNDSVTESWEQNK